MAAPKPDPAKVKQAVERLRVEHEARAVFAAEQGSDGFVLPPVGRTLADDLAEPAPEATYTIEGLHPRGGNSLLVAQHKTGKTTLLLNLLKALTDGEPFLGRFSLQPLEGRVAFWNYELDDAMFTRWAREMSVDHPDRAVVLNLRGKSFPFWLPKVRDRAARWLRKNDVQFLIIDPAAQAWRGLVVDENANSQVGQFTSALDELKDRAGVADLVLATHTGRQTFAEGQERARGASRLEDWMDAGWYLTKNRDGTRALEGRGRDVAQEAIEIAYDPSIRAYRQSGLTRAQRRSMDEIQAAVDAVASLATDDYKPKSQEVHDAMHLDQSKRTGALIAAVKAGYVEREDGPNRAKLCGLTAAGQKFHARRVPPAEEVAAKPSKKPVRRGRKGSK